MARSWSLGGLLDDNERRTIQKVPLLGDIPVIGELFKSRGKSHVKTNLMVFIRPTILRTAEDRAAPSPHAAMARCAARSTNSIPIGNPRSTSWSAITWARCRR